MAAKTKFSVEVVVVSDGKIKDMAEVAEWLSTHLTIDDEAVEEAPFKIEPKRWPIEVSHIDYEDEDSVWLPGSPLIRDIQKIEEKLLSIKRAEAVKLSKKYKVEKDEVLESIDIL